MLLLGIDIGSSSVKVALVEASAGTCVATAMYPPTELEIHAPQPGWAEQDPDIWWHCLKEALQILSQSGADFRQIAAVGISYQMHGLVCIDKNGRPLRPSIIWCDSRAVPYGARAFEALGESWSLSHLLNSPGNFTAAKLAWVRENEPHIFDQIHQCMLPGDYIALRLSGEAHTTVSGLSEGIFWDFAENRLSTELLEYFQIPASFIPPRVPTFGEQGHVSASAAAELGLPAGIPLSYRAGDQPNNAFSLNVLKPGEIAATAGTSGVVYGVSETVTYDPQSRVNTFAHVNHGTENRLGVLLCINGTGILNSWLKRHMGQHLSYDEMNQLASAVAPGSEGLYMLPFGNGAERVLANQNPGCQISGLDFNRHGAGHMFRAAQEGIVFSFHYGMEIMSQMGIRPQVIRAGKANMFLSSIFARSLASLTGAPIELYNTDGAQGAARAAGVGAGFYSHFEQCFAGLSCLQQIEPEQELGDILREAYPRWQAALAQTL